MNEIIKLASGKEVTWEEFSKWSSNKQHNSLNPYRNFGPRSMETVEKMRESTTLWWEERKKYVKVIAPNRGIPHSEETKRKIGLKSKERMKGVPKSEAHREAMREAAAKRISKKGVLITPIGEFIFKYSAAAALGITVATLRTRIAKNKSEYYYNYSPD
jgi:hypothetical protein